MSLFRVLTRPYQPSQIRLFNTIRCRLIHSDPSFSKVDQIPPGQLLKSFRFTPIDGTKERSTMDKIKELTKFYWQGIKQIIKNRREASLIRRRLLNGATISRSDYQLVSILYLFMNQTNSCIDDTCFK
jgi:hypothetical protein